MNPSQTFFISITVFLIYSFFWIFLAFISLCLHSLSVLICYPLFPLLDCRYIDVSIIVVLVGRRWGKGVGVWIYCKYCVHMYVNGKMGPVETIPGMGGGGS
jgi:hypothetical protein